MLCKENQFLRQLHQDSLTTVAFLLSYMFCNSSCWSGPKMQYIQGCRMLPVTFTVMSLLWKDYKINQFICSSFIANDVISHTASVLRSLERRKGTTSSVSLKFVFHTFRSLKGIIIPNL